MSITKYKFVALANSVAAGALLTLAALLLFIGSPAVGAPIEYRSAMSGSTVSLTAITGSNSAGITLNPVLTDTDATQPAVLSFNPSGYVVTGSSATGTAYASKFLDVEYVVSGNKTGGVAPYFTGYGLNGISFELGANYLYSSGTTAGKADALADLKYTVSVKEVNFDPNWTASSSQFDQTALPQAYAGRRVSQTGNGVKSLDVDWAALRTLAGLDGHPNWAITAVTVKFLTDASSNVDRARLTNTVNSLRMTASTELVAVPEPPTVILAGLGVAAVVADGYRRRRTRRQKVGSEVESMEGTVALTA